MDFKEVDASSVLSSQLSSRMSKDIRYIRESYPLLSTKFEDVSILYSAYRLFKAKFEDEKQFTVEQNKQFWQLANRLDTLRSLSKSSPDLLPQKDRRKNIHEMKKCMSDLTCLLTGDASDCGFSNCRSGRVADVIKYKGNEKKKCHCSDCSQSGSPKDKWWNVRVHTCSSRNSQPGNLTLTLFYDHVDSHVTKLQNGSVLFEDSKRDLSWIDFPTCDEKLAALLGKMVDSFNDLYGDLKLEYRDKTEKNNLVIIVSHPYGWPKFVSVGQLIDDCGGQGKKPKRYMYTNPTFPGSEGAYVFVLGK